MRASGPCSHALNLRLDAGKVLEVVDGVGDSARGRGAIFRCTAGDSLGEEGGEGRKACQAQQPLGTSRRRRDVGIEKRRPGR